MSTGVEKAKAIVATFGSFAYPGLLTEQPDEDYAKYGISKIAQLSQTMESERRWGYDEQTVFNIDNDLVGIMRYVVTGDGDSDGPESWDVYEVEPLLRVEYVRVR